MKKKSNKSRNKFNTPNNLNNNFNLKIFNNNKKLKKMLKFNNKILNKLSI